MPEHAPSDSVASSKQACLTFFNQAMRLLEELGRTQADAIQKGAELCAERIRVAAWCFGNGTPHDVEG